MKRRMSWTVLAAAGLAACGATIQPAELVIVNARVQTMSDARPTAQALAIRAGRIVRVGDDAQVRALVGPATRVIDAGGATVLPGFIDTHMHPVTSSAQLDDCSAGDKELRVADLAALLVACQATRDPVAGLDWLLVSDLNPAGFKASRQDLDAIEAARPVLLKATDGHSSWLNSRALAAAGITRATPDVADGRIVRDASGDPTGHLIDGAQRLADGAVPVDTLEAKVAALRKALPMLHAAGLTSVMDASVAEAELEVLASLARSGELTLDVTTALEAEADGKVDSLPKLEDQRQRYAGLHNLRVDTAKVFVDGVMEFPTQSAALLEPYTPVEGQGRSDTGNLYVDPEAFGRLATELDRRGFNVHAHAIGDRAVRVALDAFAQARGSLGEASRAKFSISHLQLVDPADWPRFAELDVYASFQLLWAQPDNYATDAVQPFIGPMRSAMMYPARSLLGNGATLVGGSDWNVSSPAPLEAIAVAMDRRDPEQPEKPPLVPMQSVALDVMLRAYTIEAARMLGIDGETGALAEGKQADVIVLDRNLDGADATAVRAAAVRYTFADGKQVHGKPD